MKKIVLYGQLCLFLLMCRHAYVAKADADPIDELLKQKATANPEKIKYVEELIKSHSTHPRILELRYFRTGQLMGSSQEPEHFHSVIGELDQLVDDAGKGIQLSFDCKVRIAEILYHCLHDKEAAYQQYKSLEHHPVLSPNNIQSDYHRVYIYRWIAGSASAISVPKLDEVEKYTRLVMAYPYLGMEDREMYRKFYKLYEEAGRLFIATFDRYPEKLLNLEIYPSHPELWKYRKEAIEQTIDLEGLRKEILSLEYLESALKDANEARHRQNAAKPHTSPIDTTKKTDGLLTTIEGKPLAQHRSPTPPTLSCSSTHLTMWIVGGIIALAITVIIVFLIRTKLRYVDPGKQ